MWRSFVPSTHVYLYHGKPSHEAGSVSHGGWAVTRDGVRWDNVTNARSRWLDTSNPRLWVCELPESYGHDDFVRELDAAVEALRALRAGRRVVALLDLSQVKSSDPRRRQRASQFLSEHAGLIAERTVAWGFLIPNPVVRGAITAIRWVGSFPVPIKMFAERFECEQWLEQQLALDDLAREKRI